MRNWHHRKNIKKNVTKKGELSQKKWDEKTQELHQTKVTTLELWKNNANKHVFFLIEEDNDIDSNDRKNKEKSVQLSQGKLKLPMVGEANGNKNAWLW